MEGHHDGCDEVGDENWQQDIVKQRVDGSVALGGLNLGHGRNDTGGIRD